MANRGPRLEFAVGAFLVLALGSLLVLAIASTNGRFGMARDSYELTARFTQIGQLRPNAPVKIVRSFLAIRTAPENRSSAVRFPISARIAGARRSSLRRSTATGTRVGSSFRRTMRCGGAASTSSAS